ncbi:hypothetical protein GCM10022225_34190 [Plantactinospora mayteni]|uniref:Uncharacterized protein n=1 Tax=Plantactinospora mayteni TaxID=566021 RepID=A0ABQ4EMV9_9ACTN|nr:hypothetical protein Pma05_25450 [Plantactinospora mayteni]
MNVKKVIRALPTIATAAPIWRPLAVTQDRLALDGLDQLRKLLGAPSTPTDHTHHHTTLR